jgi:hypothetical protein
VKFGPGTPPLSRFAPEPSLRNLPYDALFSLFVFVDTKKQLTSNKSLKAMPDLMDATHFRDAAYADVLVTHDEDFRTVAERASTGLKIMTFDDFARLLLSHAPALGL